MRALSAPQLLVLVLLVSGCAAPASGRPTADALCTLVPTIDAMIADLRRVEPAARDHDIVELKVVVDDSRSRAAVLAAYTKAAGLSTRVDRAIYAIGGLGDQGVLPFQWDYEGYPSNPRLFDQDADAYASNVLPLLDTNVTNVGTEYASAGLDCWHV